MQLFGRNGLANHAAAGAYGFLLSALPALLLIAAFLLAVLRTSPRRVAELITGIGVLGGTFDEKSLIESFLAASQPGISGIVSVVSIIWTARVFALSLQRGLKVIFPAANTRNPLIENLIIFAIEFLIILFALALVIFSPFLAGLSTLITSLVSGAALVLMSYIAFRIVPDRAPSRRAAITGALVCTVLFGLVSFVLHFFTDQTRYAVLYGALGSLVILLANVYFFFMFFFIGAQLAFVIDSFESLLFSKLRNLRTETSKPQNPVERRVFSSTDGSLQKYLRSYGEGETLFTQGDRGREIYYLLSGEAAVSLSGAAESGDKSISTIKPGVFFGEMGYLLSENRTATVKAKTDLVAIVLPPEVFDEVLRSDSATARIIIENLSRRLKQTNEKVISQ
jgi:membrane protein